MKKQLLITFLSIFVGSLLYGQVSKNYKQLSKAENANYYEIVKDARAEFDTKNLSILKNKKAKKQFERWAYYWENRVFKDGGFPSENLGYYNAGILDANGKIVTQNQNLSNRNSSQSWTNIGPEQSDLDNNGYSNYPQMGRLNAFLRIKHPTDSNQDVLFVGAPDGGVWKSTDGGTTWTAKLDFIAGIGVTDIKTIDGTTTANYTTQPIYVSTGDYDASHVKSIGVLKSTDGGETFNSTGLSYTIDQQKTLGDLVVIDANTVFVGESDGIMKTLDGGTNWTVAHPSGFSNVLMGRASRNGNEIMFTDAFGGIYYTSDYTNNSNWNTAVTASSFDKTAVTVDGSGDFFIQNSAGQVKKFNKTNSTFANVGNIPSGYNSQGGYNQALIVTNDIMVTGEFNGQSSTNNGGSWVTSLNGYWNNSSSPGTYIHSDHHRMGKLDGSLEFWSVNDGGLSYITYPSVTNTKPTITYKSSKVKVTQSYTVAINPSANDGAAVIANQDNDAFSKRNGTWYAVAMGDGIQSAINYNSPDIRYAGNQNGYVSQSDTGFQGQLSGNGNTVQIPGASFYFPLEMHKTNPNILYGGGNEVYKLDATTGLTIATTNSGLTGTVITIATHGNAVLASNGSSIKFSTNQASTWSSITAPTDPLTNITSVDFDATNSNIIYVTYSGYTSGEKVYKTSNGGTSWTNITSNLPNIVINEIILKQGQSSEYLFAATELGVYFTSNGGTSWSKLGQDLPNVNVKDIDIHYTADKLVAGTFGRGLWEVSIENTTLGIDAIGSIEKEFSFYPNPVKNNLFINTQDSNTYNYILYNVVGGIVKKGKVTSSGIDVSDMAKNMYMIRVYNDESSITKKIIIE